MCHDKLDSFIKSNFQLVYNHKISYTELENMMPWERHIFISLVTQEIERQKQEIESMKASR